MCVCHFSVWPRSGRSWIYGELYSVWCFCVFGGFVLFIAALSLLLYSGVCFQCWVDYLWSVSTVTHAASVYHTLTWLFLRDLHRLLSWRCSVYVLWFQAVLSFHSTSLRIFIRFIRTRWFLLLTLSLLTSLRLSEYNGFFFSFYWFCSWSNVQQVTINDPHSIKTVFISDSWLLGFCVTLRPLVVVSSKCSRLYWLVGAFCFNFFFT